MQIKDTGKVAHSDLQYSIITTVVIEVVYFCTVSDRALLMPYFFYYFDCGGPKQYSPLHFQKGHWCTYQRIKKYLALHSVNGQHIPIATRKRAIIVKLMISINNFCTS